ncbi:MAG: lamin tail domain-containing protein [Opitutales bacterium]
MNDGTEAALVFVRSVAFPTPSAGDISPAGERIVLRREEAAMLWSRLAEESVGDALGRAGIVVPVIGPPVEPNGEAIAFLPNDTGYVTLSEGEDPAVHFFQAICPRPPAFNLSPTNRSAFVGETIQLSASVVGYPPPQLEWRRNNTLLPAQTNAMLSLVEITVEEAGVYTVMAVNDHGMASASAQVTVRLMPDVRITEVHPAPLDQAGVATADWWELTNFEPQTVDLSNWRFNDNDGGLEDPFILPPGITIKPAQSIVFVQALSPAEFREWWGASNVPESVPIVAYTGGGLGFSANGDSIRLWNDFVTDSSRLAASVDFGIATSGTSFNYDPRIAMFGMLSRLGSNGVIRAASTQDIGSPGRILGPASNPRLTISLPLPGTVRIGFFAEAGRFYRLEARTALAGGEWFSITNGFIATQQGTAQLEFATPPPHRYFRVRVE